MPKISLSNLSSGFRSSNKLNENFQEIRDAIDNTISRDGSTPNQMMAPLDMNSERIINVGAPVNLTDAVRLQDLVNGVVSQTQVVDDLSALRAQTWVGGRPDVVDIISNWVTGDGGGTFRWDATSTATDDGGITIKEAATLTGRWIRQLEDNRLNVRWWGARPDNNTANRVTNNTAITAALAFTASTVGTYRVCFPAGSNFPDNAYQVSQTFVVPEGVEIEGDGYESIVNFGALNGSGHTGDGFDFGSNRNCAIRDLYVVQSGRDGIAARQTGAPGPVSNPAQFVAERVTSRFNGRHGWNLNNIFNARLASCLGIANGQIGGVGYGFSLPGFSTSTLLDQCQSSDNPSGGYYVDDTIYSSFIACGADDNLGAGYEISNCSTVSFINCGGEYNTRLFYVRASDALATGALITDTSAVTIMGCFGVGMLAAQPSFLDAESLNGRLIQLTMIDCREWDSANGVSMRMAGFVRVNRIGMRMVGTTATSGGAAHTDFETAAQTNLANTFSGAQQFGTTSTSQGRLNLQCSGAASGGGAMVNGLSNGGTQFAIGHDSVINGGTFNGNAVIWASDGNFRAQANWLPRTDSGFNLGSGTFRWGTVFAVTGTINTSDATQKTPIEDLSEAEKRAANTIKAGIGKYQWLDAIAEKGADKARIHIGVTAQAVQAAFEAEGLDPWRYAILCADDITEMVEVQKTITETDADGNEIEVEATVIEERPRLDTNGQPVRRLGVRYDQLNMFLMGAL